MIAMKIDQAKGLFFDSKKVTAAVGKAERRVLSRFGAFVRQRARSSIRKRKKAARPGAPPSSHTGLLKRFIFFVYEPERASVVIGPARLNQVIGDAPAALEYGGKSRVTSGRRHGKRVIRTAKIKARPFMQPAFDREQQDLPELWRDSIR